VIMAMPHDAPTTAELLESVREWLDHEVIPSSEGRTRFHARVAVNILGIVEREIELGPAHKIAHGARLERLGVADDFALATAIRAGEFADRADELRAELLDSVLDKLAVANPRYTSPD
jgi:hypothetical protein